MAFRDCRVVIESHLHTCMHLHVTPGQRRLGDCCVFYSTCMYVPLAAGTVVLEELGMIMASHSDLAVPRMRRSSTGYIYGSCY